MSDRWDDEDALVWVDHREEEDALLRAFAAQLPPNDPLEPFWRDDALWVRWRGAEHRIPLTFSPVDRYVALHSLAALVAPDYRILVQQESLESDTHGFLLMPRAEWEALDAAARARLDATFADMEPGIDAFSGLAVPYWGNEAANPDVVAQRAEQSAATDAFVRELMGTPSMQQHLRDMQRDIAGLAAPRPSLARRLLRGLLWGVLGLMALMVLLVAAALLGADPKPAVAPALNARLEDGARIDLAELAPFAWERVHIFSPYTARATVCEQVGAAWRRCASQAPEWVDEGEYLWVFEQAGRVVHRERVPRRAEFCAQSCALNLPRAQAVFTARLRPGSGMEPRRFDLVQEGR